MVETSASSSATSLPKGSHQHLQALATQLKALIQSIPYEQMTPLVDRDGYLAYAWQNWQTAEEILTKMKRATSKPTLLKPKEIEYLLRKAKRLSKMEVLGASGGTCVIPPDSQGMTFVGVGTPDGMHLAYTSTPMANAHSATASMFEMLEQLPTGKSPEAKAAKKLLDAAMSTGQINMQSDGVVMRAFATAWSDRCAHCAVAKGEESASGDGTVSLQHCSRCGAAHYCSKECQRADWKEHKKVCEVMQNLWVAWMKRKAEGF